MYPTSEAPSDISLWQALTTSYEVVVLDEAAKDSSSAGDIQLPTSAGASGQSSGTDAVCGGDYVDLGEGRSKPEEKDVPSSSGGWFRFNKATTT